MSEMGLFATADARDDELVSNEMDLSKAFALDEKFTRNIGHSAIKLVCARNKTKLEVTIKFHVSIHLTLLIVANEISREGLDRHENTLSTLGENRNSSVSTLIRGVLETVPVTDSIRVRRTVDLLLPISPHKRNKLIANRHSSVVDNLVLPI